MSRMLQALRQIEAKAERSPQPAVSAAASRAVAVQSAPAETIAVESAEQVFDRVEAALAAENLCPPDSLAALQLEPLPPLDSLTAEETFAAEGGTGVSPVSAAPASAADPYVALADSIVAQWVSPGGRGDNAEINGEFAGAGKIGTAAAVLLFTSPGGGEGKSTTLTRLAPELQRRVSGEVLVVDGSLRAAAPAAHPNIHLTGRPIEALAGLRKRCRLVLVDAAVATVFRNCAADGLLRRDVSRGAVGRDDAAGLGRSGCRDRAKSRPPRRLHRRRLSEQSGRWP